MSRAFAAAAALSLQFLCTPVAAQSWTGGGGDANWSTSANWSGGAPSNGLGGLALFSLGGSPLASTLDVPWTLTNLQLFNFNWTIGGSVLTLSGNGTVQQFGGAPTITNDIVLVGNRTFDIGSSLALSNVSGTGTLAKTGNGTLTIGNLASSGNVTVIGGTLVASPTANMPNVTVDATLVTNAGQWGSLSGAGTVTIEGATFFNQAVDTTFSGSIAGPGELNKAGPGRLTLGGSNSWSGLTTVAMDGTLEIAGPAAFPPGGTVLNQGTLALGADATIAAIFGTGNVQVTGGTINGGGSWIYSGSTIVTGGSLLTTNLQSQGAMTVAFPGTWTTIGNATIGRLAGNGTTILQGDLVVGTDGQDSTYEGFVQQGPAVSSFNKVGAGTLTITNQLDSPVILQAGALRLQAAAVNSSVLVKAGAKLSGLGTANTIQVEAGGTIEPSLLAANTVSGAGSVRININGTALVSQYGQVNPIFFDATGMALELAGSYVPVPGNSFTIVDAFNRTGTFNGLPAGTVIPDFNGVPLRISYTGGDGNDVVLSVATQAITHSVTGNGSISPSSPHVVVHGQPAVFTITPADNNHLVSVGGDCGGLLTGNTYSIAAVVADCTLTATFGQTNYLVTPVTAVNGTIAPAAVQFVAPGAKATFTITPSTGFAVEVGGTCPAGSFAGTVYTTGVIVQDCTVAPAFSVAKYTITPSAGAGGTISPSTDFLAEHGTTPTLTVTPDPGFVASVGGTCGGMLSGTTYTVNPVTASCTVSATFSAVHTYSVVLEGYQVVGPYVDTTAGGGGTVTYMSATRKLTLDLPFSGLADTAAHIHGPAARGEIAPVLFTLAPGNPKSDEVTLTPEQEAMLLAGQLYVDLESVIYPQGHIRGQIDNLGATVLHTLTVAKPATGLIQGGTEAGNNLLNCGDRCTMQVPHGAIVELMGIGGSPGLAIQWGGDCSAAPLDEHCELAMDGDKSVSGSFVQQPVQGTDMRSTLTAAPNPAAAGQDVTFTFTMENLGPPPVAMAGELALPAGMTFVSASAGCEFSSDPSDAYVYCEPAGSLAAGASATFSIVLRAAAPGTYPVVSDTYGYDQSDFDASNNSATVNLVVNPGARMSNISTRMQVGTGNDVMIGGFVIGGSGTKRVAIVATGPSLAPFGIANPLANPMLTLVRSSDQAVIATNDDWQGGSNAAELTAAGFAPSNPLEAAILADLPPGAYTAIVSGADNGTGVSVIGVYEVDHPETPLINISTRGRVLTGNDVMIGGFVVSGAAPKALAIVATGPSLAAFGITSPLANPRITLVRSSDQAVVATNDDWQGDANASQLQAAGFSPGDPLEAGLYVTLPPGAYTVIVEGVDGGTGVGVIGVYATN
jgi:uncharacterized repeat protein (TIGR01451 family)